MTSEYLSTPLTSEQLEYLAYLDLLKSVKGNLNRPVTEREWLLTKRYSHDANDLRAKRKHLERLTAKQTPEFIARNQRRKEREQERLELLAKHPTASHALTLTELRALDTGKTSQQKAMVGYYDRNKRIAALEALAANHHDSNKRLEAQNAKLEAQNEKLEARIQALESLLLPPLA